LHNFSEAESEVQRIKLAVIKTEEERHAMERKVGDTELMMHRMVEEAERRQQEAERLKTEVRLKPINTKITNKYSSIRLNKQEWLRRRQRTS
jgi:hypothetical protein